jgi:shikimate dehydrogenase
VLAGLIEQGAREIRLINRTFARAQELERRFGRPLAAVDWKDRGRALASMLVNTTRQGMVGEPALDLPLQMLPVTALVSDIIYIPRETPLLSAARARGNPTVNGLGMLLHQARPAFHAWFGIMPEVTPELRALIESTT